MITPPSTRHFIKTLEGVLAVGVSLMFFDAAYQMNKTFNKIDPVTLPVYALSAVSLLYSGKLFKQRYGLNRESEKKAE